MSPWTKIKRCEWIIPLKYFVGKTSTHKSLCCRKEIVNVSAHLFITPTWHNFLPGAEIHQAPQLTLLTESFNQKNTCHRLWQQSSELGESHPWLPRPLWVWRRNLQMLSSFVFVFYIFFQIYSSVHRLPNGQLEINCGMTTKSTNCLSIVKTIVNFLVKIKKMVLKALKGVSNLCLKMYENFWDITKLT